MILSKMYKEGELTAIIQTALQQMGVFVQVDIISTNGPTSKQSSKALQLLSLQYSLNNLILSLSSAHQLS